jgi:hypothetical protein
MEQKYRRAIEKNHHFVSSALDISEEIIRHTRALFISKLSVIINRQELE